RRPARPDARPRAREQRGAADVRQQARTTARRGSRARGQAGTAGAERNVMNEVRVGRDPFRYRVEPGWARVPGDGPFREAVGVACDARGRVYVFLRGPSPVRVFEADGTFVTAWGDGLFVRPHGIFVGPDDTVYCTDDFDHTVRAFTPDGRPLLTLGTSGHPSDTGATSTDYRTIRRAGAPFHYPTNLAVGPAGDLYVAGRHGHAPLHPL